MSLLSCLVYPLKWHSLSREEQSKYYEKARQERQLHMELYPGWSARDNYGYVSKKKKRKKDRSPADSGGIITNKNIINNYYSYMLNISKLEINNDEKQTPIN